MKIYTIFLLIFCAAFAGNLNAQEQTYGIEIGGFHNVQKLYSSHLDLAESLNGYSFSITGLRHESFTERLNLTFGVGYKMTRYHVRDYAIDFGSIFSNTEFNWYQDYSEDRSLFHYATFSTNMKINLWGAKTKLFIKPRMEINQFLARSAESLEKTPNGEYIGKSITVSQYILREPNRTFAFIGCGIGVEFPLKEQNLFIEIQSSYSFGKLFQPLSESDFIKTTINARIIPIGLVTGINF